MFAVCTRVCMEAVPWVPALLRYLQAPSAPRSPACSAEQVVHCRQPHVWTCMYILLRCRQRQLLTLTTLEHLAYLFMTQHAVEHFGSYISVNNMKCVGSLPTNHRECITCSDHNRQRLRRSEGDFLGDVGLAEILRRAGLPAPKQHFGKLPPRFKGSLTLYPNRLDPWVDPLALRPLPTAPQPLPGSPFLGVGPLGLESGSPSAPVPRAPDPEGMRGRRHGRSAAIEALLAGEAAGGLARDQGVPTRVRGGQHGGSDVGTVSTATMSAPARLPLLGAERDEEEEGDPKTLNTVDPEDAAGLPPTTPPIACGRPGALDTLAASRSLEDSAGRTAGMLATSGGDASVHSGASTHSAISNASAVCGRSAVSSASLVSGQSAAESGSGVADSAESIGSRGDQAAGLALEGGARGGAPPSYCAKAAGAHASGTQQMIEL